MKTPLPPTIDPKTAALKRARQAREAAERARATARYNARRAVAEAFLTELGERARRVNLTGKGDPFLYRVIRNWPK